MCGRYTLSTPGDEVADLFGVAVPPLLPRFNLAPTQEAPVVLVRSPGAPPALELLRWGLVPAWAEDPAIGNRMINARAETAAEKPAYRQSFRKQRCLVVADGFYEWTKQGPAKQPYLIRRRDRLPFAFAGLWASWRRPDATRLETFTILTTTPNEVLRPLHDRMPVLLERDAHALWLDPGAADLQRLQAFLVPASAEGWEAVPVGRAVNNPAHDAPDCIEPLLAPAPGAGDYPAAGE